MYISAMLAFKNAARLVHDKQVLQERMKHTPSIILDGLLSRFTETSKDKNEYVLVILRSCLGELTPWQDTHYFNYGDNVVDSHVCTLSESR